MEVPRRGWEVGCGGVPIAVIQGDLREKPCKHFKFTLWVFASHEENEFLNLRPPFPRTAKKIKSTQRYR